MSEGDVSDSSVYPSALTMLQARVPQDVCRSLADGQENMPTVQTGHCGGVQGEGECRH